MITAKLQGGIGNVMFQIATAHALALRNDGDTCCFNLKGVQHGCTPHYDSLEKYRTNILSRVNDMDLGLNYAYAYYETTFGYKTIEFSPGNMCLFGYFQSYKYFDDYRKEIQALFAPTNEVSNLIDSKYGYLLNDGRPTVSLHVRRGDYLKFSNVYHQLTYDNYYREALLKCEDDVIVLVCSDDIEWCKKNITSKRLDIRYIENEEDYIEMYLMSKCDHNIISNSTFSWWSAYLNQHVDKVVMYPKRWFSNDMSSKDICPERWIEI